MVARAMVVALAIGALAAHREVSDHAS